jgi:hypothetical protein
MSNLGHSAGSDPSSLVENLKSLFLTRIRKSMRRSAHNENKEKMSAREPHPLGNKTMTGRRLA